MTAIQDLESSEDMSVPPKREHCPQSVVVGVGVGVVIVVVVCTGSVQQRVHQHAPKEATHAATSK